MNPKVSLVVPCYNGAKFIDRFMQAILLLDYDNIQLIITDDGSTDHSYEILQGYNEKMNEKGVEYIVFQKDNGGQPSAFNVGIKYATGKYVAWPDIDDRMHPDFISKKVEYMEENPSVDFLLSKSAIVPLDNPDRILGYTWPEKITDNKNLVDRTLRDEGAWFEPGAYFARTESLDRLIKDRHIYDGCGTWTGAQIQIVLPFFYKGNIGYLDECLYDYYIHENQHHSQVKEKKQIIRKISEIKKVLEVTIGNLNADDEKEMLKVVEERVIRSECINAFISNDVRWYDEAYSKFHTDMITSKDKMRYQILHNKCLYFVYSIYKKIKKNPLGGRK